MSAPTLSAGAPSPRTFAMQHQRPKNSFIGCSRIGDYEVLGKLGEGTFGEVHRARSKNTGAVVALKKIILHNEKDGFPITALREIKLLKLLSHRNVLRLEDMAVEHPARTSGFKFYPSHLSGTLTPHVLADKRKKPVMYMVMPYMDHDLSGLLDNPSITFTEPQIKCYLVQLLQGLKYLHENKILHRDMKAANLLINNKGILQIADFGLARLYDEAPPKKGCGGGEGRRDYTSLVVTRWYRPPELLLHLKKYTTAIDMWGVGCVFGEMLWGKPILAGESDGHQLDIIFDLCGTPNDDNMPGWRQLPGAEVIKPRPRPGDLSSRFAKYGQGPVALLRELLRLDWKKRINAIDALEHPYLHSAPLPAQPGELPVMEESHEFDRRKFHDRKAALPPAPKGGTVGRGPNDGPGGPGAGFNSGDPYRNGVNSGRYPPASHRNGPVPGERMPAWSRGPHGLPPRPPPPVDNYGSGGPDMYRDRERDRPSRSRPAGGGRNDVDTYIPSYRERERDRDRERDRERDRPPRDRRYDAPLEEDAHGGYPRGYPRDRHGRTRSRSPIGGGRLPDREWERDRR